LGKRLGVSVEEKKLGRPSIDRKRREGGVLHEVKHHTHVSKAGRGGSMKSTEEKKLSASRGGDWETLKGPETRLKTSTFAEAEKPLS